MDNKLDLLKLSQEKSILKQLKKGQSIEMTCTLSKFNDYKKKQERNMLISTHAVYNLKGTDIKRRIEVQKIKGISFSKIGSEFILHIPSEYDYRYSSSDQRDKIIYYILKAYARVTGQKMPIYYREEISLAVYAMTKEDKKKYGVKQIKGKYKLHNDETYKQYADDEDEKKEIVRKTTKTLFTTEHEDVAINDFVPKVVLGKGGFGTVLLVEKRGTKELYAMKIIEKKQIIKKGQLEHTKTEKIILEHVNHPYLVNLAYAFQTPQKLYFLMQFMKGGQLYQHLANAKRFPQKQVKFYVMQIALGLGHLHDKDLIYRDLKLQNILMDEKGNVSLTDFGMAKIVRDEEVTRTFCGTPEYLAPEVVAGKGYNKAADWWSLGILAYEMLFSMPPFYHENVNQLFRRIRENQLKFPTKIKISDEAKDFIEKMLKKNPSERLGSKGQGSQITSHPWFSDLNRDKMLNKQLEAPFKPKVDGDDWLEGFDKQYTSQKPIYDDKDEKSTANEEFGKAFEFF